MLPPRYSTRVVLEVQHHVDSPRLRKELQEFIKRELTVSLQTETDIESPLRDASLTSCLITDTEPMS